MSNFSFWNGQPVNAPLYPQVGDMMQPNASCYSGGQWPTIGHDQAAPMQTHNLAQAQAQTQAQVSHQGSSMNLYGGRGMHPQSQQSQQYPGMGGASMAGQSPMSMQSMMGMGDYSSMSSPLTCPVPNTFFDQNQAQGSYEPCIENGEAFCAYNGMDMGGSYGGGTQGQGSGKGGFW
ncbi:uncharacterized protein LOC117889600 [Drosophila subobscura]|uniref:uncharacterized protein LOC117889600 n=1 Tax=Drosophila subobscura TaxID=7241 RepID=UPI00155A9C36|nr:uncharacterized protein LOC117889600 [Drosophila subobscura]